MITKSLNILIVTIILMIIISINLMLDNNDNNNININNNKIDISSKNILKNIGSKIEYTYSSSSKKRKGFDDDDDDDDDNDINNDEAINEIFPIVSSSSSSSSSNLKKKRLKLDVYDAETGKLLLASSKRNEYRSFPNIDEIPKSCGFGKLYFYRPTGQWECKCLEPRFFSGIYCDEPQDLLTKKYKCLKVAHIDNFQNTNIATFNPILEGVCVKCSTPDATPIIDSPIPKCGIINDDTNSNDDNDDDDDDDEKFFEGKSHCFADPLNPRTNNSILNKYVPGYGCVCDYYNGFVEVKIENYQNSNEISHACIKIGRKMIVQEGGGGEGGEEEEQEEYYHKSHLAYYTLQNLRKPIQIHEYTQLEPPFNKLFKNYKAVLVDQPALDIVHEHDWLNRCIKPKKSQKIRKITNEWPVVHKYHLRNSYESRKETHPISALTLEVGRGFETKHWYELTNMRYLSNAVWGHPIVYGYNSPNPIWHRKNTLNPLGAKYDSYYGATLLYKPGSIVYLDTRGYKSSEEEEEKNSSKVVTIPPNNKGELIQDLKYAYIAWLYNNYTVK